LSELRDLLASTSAHAADFLESLDERPVLPEVDLDELRRALRRPLPDGPTDARTVVDELVRDADPGITASQGGRYFGFVIGGAVPAAVAADFLTAAWDQNAGLYVGSPAAGVVEEVAGDWLIELLGLPAGVGFGFVTGCQMAHVTALAAARHHVLAAHGFDVEGDGLSGAPPIRIVVGAQRHATIDRALRFLGLGAPRAIVPADDQGRIDTSALADVLAEDGGPTIVCVQAGEVNTGAFDDFAAAADAASEHGAWLHVDGAFGLWAAASPSLAHLVEGAERADSWATDMHKWLNVPYDSGIAFCRHRESHRAALGTQAAYLVQADADGPRDQLDWNPEFSRRARGFTVYAALRSLGRSGVADLVEGACAHARRFGDELAKVPGCEILNEIVLNQVLFRFSTDAETDAVLSAVQASGEAWMGGTLWQGRRAIRVSVSNWSTTDDDVDRTVRAFAAAARGLATA
jgi:glutamate/tyrosine decarboxylase-like PLP-dependent enzyme